MAKTDLTAQRLRELLHYDPETGIFTAQEIRTGRKNRSGEIGSVNRNGYRVMHVIGQRYRTHRLAWLYMTGEWPKSQIDHIDGDRLNNKWGNLRDVPRSINLQNLHAAQVNNKIGLLGVSKVNQKWLARIFVDGKATRLGRFETPEQAHQAYLNAKRALHMGCSI